MYNWDPTDFLPLFALSIPIIAIMGGITAGIVRMYHRQRSFELLQKERIAAIERGLDPDKIASLQRPLMFDEQGRHIDSVVANERLRQGLLIGGIVTLFVGISLCVFLYGVTGHHVNGGAKVWLVGTIPGAVGVALLLSSYLIRPTASGPATPSK